MGKLYGTRCYLIGAMDRVKDGGTGWRDEITLPLVKLGIVVLNPCDKPIKIAREDVKDRLRRRRLKKQGRWSRLVGEMKTLRAVDLRMVDMSDFLICNLDTSVHMCGTYEELFWANRLKRPVLIHCEQRKINVPDWLFATLPHRFFFNTWKQLLNYINKADKQGVKHLKRWMFFDYERLTPEGQLKYYKSRESA
jgi:hypothetical protein